MLTHFTAGDSFRTLESFPAYPASSGWLAKLRLVPRVAGSAVIELAAAASGADHLFTAAPGTTANWASGFYGWAIWVERAAESISLSRGELAIAPDPRTVSAGFDGRSVARKTLDDLIAARASWVASRGGVRRYSINGREQEFLDAAALDREISFWQAQVRSEEAAAGIAAGLPPRNRIFVRFGRPR